ncbi:hypothetical protein PsorP6_019360 [Peronosclerospora sorghi]|nr:hypothetical protein PsorP6_019360 [Peronosclerospora sorghi]
MRGGGRRKERRSFSRLRSPRAYASICLSLITLATLFACDEQVRATPNKVQGDVAQTIPASVRDAGPKGSETPSLPSFTIEERTRPKLKSLNAGRHSVQGMDLEHQVSAALLNFIYQHLRDDRGAQFEHPNAIPEIFIHALRDGGLTAEHMRQHFLASGYDLNERDHQHWDAAQF